MHAVAHRDGNSAAPGRDHHAAVFHEIADGLQLHDVLGHGARTTRRQPRPESSRTWYPVAFAKARASVSVMKAPMGFS